jgi:phosphohistidine phosphatase
MRLAILRHARAVDRGEWSGTDADRPLTATGEDVAEQVCHRLRPLVDQGAILASPWLRAHQTAAIAGRIWDLPVRVEPWLAGDALPADQAPARIPAGLDPVLVGHEPDLSALVKVLTGGAVQLKKAGFAILEGDPVPGGMHLRLLINPGAVRDLGD